MKFTAFLMTVIMASAAAKKKTDVPITEVVTLGVGSDEEASMQGRDIEYNTCVPFDPAKFGHVKVCGANTDMLIYLRNRCEDYNHYTDSVGKCTGAVTDDGCDDTSPDQNHWLEAAQSYSIVHCGAGKGEIHDFSGPACSGLEECMKYAQEQAEQEKMDKMEAEYKSGFKGKGLVGARYGRGQRNTISTSFDF